MAGVKKSQKVAEEQGRDKFAGAEPVAKAPKKATSAGGRINPQLSCTIEPEDKETLDKLAVFLTTKAGKILNMSVVIRALIRLGAENRDALASKIESL